MPRTAIPVTDMAGTPGGDGAVLNNPSFTAADAANGMDFVNDGRVHLVVKNDDASQKQVTIVAVADQAGRATDEVVTIAAGQEAHFGRKHPRWWNQSDGKVQVDFDADTSVTVLAVRDRG